MEQWFHMVERMPRYRTKEPTPMKTPSGSQAVDRAGSLLIAIIEAPEPLPFAELVASTDLPKSTASRLLTSLERHGLVRRGPDSEVGPGPALTRYASSRRPGELLRIAQPHLDTLGETTGETINLAVPGTSAVEQIAQVDSRYMLGAVNWVGRSVPFHCSALGKVFLAHGVVALPKGRLEKRTDHTVTTREQLETELASVRKLGYATADSELEPGLVAVAAPITGPGGAVVAAVSMTGPSVRLTVDRLPDLGRLVADAASAISRALALQDQPPTRKVTAA
jgi:DNA-binding IclR family transcriptional regulator